MLLFCVYQDVTPYCGALIVFLSITGYLGGYIIIDLSARRHQLVTRDLFVSSHTSSGPGQEVVCPSACLRRAQNYGQWIDWSANSFQLFAYSAIFDDRSSLDLDTSVTAGLVRIMVVSSVLAEKESDKGTECMHHDCVCFPLCLCYIDFVIVTWQPIMRNRDDQAVRQFKAIILSAHSLHCLSLM